VVGRSNDKVPACGVVWCGVVQRDDDDDDSIRTMIDLVEKEKRKRKAKTTFPRHSPTSLYTL
jgi:hypothetical protein